MICNGLCRNVDAVDGLQNSKLDGVSLRRPRHFCTSVIYLASGLYLLAIRKMPASSPRQEAILFRFQHLYTGRLKESSDGSS